MSTDPDDPTAPRPLPPTELRQRLETVGEWQLHAGRRLVRLLESQRRLEAHVDALVEHMEQLRIHQRELEALSDATRGDFDGAARLLGERHAQLAEAQELLERAAREVSPPEE